MLFQSWKKNSTQFHPAKCRKSYTIADENVQLTKTSLSIPLKIWMKRNIDKNERFDAVHTSVSCVFVSKLLHAHAHTLEYHIEIGNTSKFHRNWTK